MSIRVNRASVIPEKSEYATTWRHIRRDGPVGVGVGLVTFNRLPAGTDPGSIAEAHDVPEIHYVLSGRGTLYEDGAEMPIQAGDALVTPAGRRHCLWATTDEPLTMIYVAISPTAVVGNVD